MTLQNQNKYTTGLMFNWYFTGLEIVRESNTHEELSKRAHFFVLLNFKNKTNPKPTTQTANPSHLTKPNPTENLPGKQEMLTRW